MKKFALFLILLVGCTGNTRAKNFGGSTTVHLPSNQKLVNITWKENSMWYLTKDMKEDDIPEKYTFKESSSYGIWEGEVKIWESKKDKE